MSNKLTTAAAILLTLFASRCADASRIPQVIGEPHTYVVRRGQSLFKIARVVGVGLPELMRLNHLQRQKAKPGTRLLLPTEHIPPLTPDHGIVLNIPERAVYVFQGHGKPPYRYAVAVGQADPKWRTALGNYRLARKQVNPTWHPPKSMVEAGQVRDDPVPPGPENPLGDRWMGWSLTGFGFHSTDAPRSVGRVTSHGCVRLYPEAARQMFDRVRVGMPIYSVYEPVVIGQRRGRFYLTVFPDVYHVGGTSLAAVEHRLADLGLLPLVDSDTLKRVVARAEGYPRLIAGSEEQMVVNGKTLTSPVAPSLVRGGWVVPVRPIVEALGGKLTEHGREIAVTAQGHELTLAIGTEEAKTEGKPITLPVVSTRVDNTLMAPLDPLLKLFGAKADWQKGKTLAITTQPSPPTSPSPPSTTGRTRT